MKAVFLFLVLLNLAYLGWQAWIVPAKAPPALLEAEGVPRLVLIGEDPNDPAFRVPYSPTTTLPASMPVPAQETPTDTAQSFAASTSASVEPQTDEHDVASVAAPAPEIVVAEAPAGISPNQVPAPVEVAVAPASGKCVSLGPFLNLREATEATAMLIESGLEPNQRLAESQVWFGHWVHLPPQASREAAVAVVEELRSKGVTDIYIEPSGPMQHSISLGVFSDRTHAETRAGNIRRMGISPQIRDRYRDSSVYWVDFELPAGQVIDAAAYQSSPNRVLRIEGRTCPENS